MRYTLLVHYPEMTAEQLSEEALKEEMAAFDAYAKPSTMRAKSPIGKTQPPAPKVPVVVAVRAPRLNTDLVLSSAYRPLRGAGATLRSRSTTKHEWIDRKTVT